MDASPDLKSAKVYISILGSQKERKGTLIGLQNASGFIQSALASVLSLRTIPTFRFLEDTGLLHANHIHAVMDHIHKEKPYVEEHIGEVEHT